ncbi:hypothetical protein M080_6566, partial [Bacteroides fragilis str. 3397 T10]
MFSLLLGCKQISIIFSGLHLFIVHSPCIDCIQCIIHVNRFDTDSSAG